MPGLATSLRSFEIDQLQQLAQLWAIDAPEQYKESLLLTLSLNLAEADQVVAHLDSLPESAQTALMLLKANGGKMLWSSFSHRFGEIRALGQAKRKKEKPWDFPKSESERLWYHGLIGRDFLRVGEELQEMAYIPDELLPLLPEELVPLELSQELPPLGDESDVSLQIQASSRVLDHTCTLLAALRFKDPEKYLAKQTVDIPNWTLLQALLKGTGLLDQTKQPTDLARNLLELPRTAALLWLARQWLTSTQFNELSFLPGLKLEPARELDLAKIRQSVFDLLKKQQTEQWFWLQDFTDLVRQNQPDFLRQQEDYFSWTILKEGQASDLLTGFESWPQVEGAYIEFILMTMLPLLGLADTSKTKQSPAKLLFRLKKRIQLMESLENLTETESENDLFTLTSTGKISMTDRSQRLIRYQLSRFSEWLSLTPELYQYQLTPTSLSLAGQQGLRPKHLIQLLRNHAENGLPPVLYEAIKRWEAEGGTARIETHTVLRLSSPELLQTLRESAAARWLGESLGPTAVILKAGGEKIVQQTLAGLGHLSDLENIEVLDD